ncbi:uncharacterized protein BO95DRAFT_441989 [Aspergillus brunneoviolaceus CBS 621.78]|uniref:Uncharacterized protein n=1 Tax=Aspergillus brunneoviolaceus CBS 621.78 TaxID=1450534 RepID=A0ACD1GBY6_9EURO|nr:hypothetical protein BO95DRAFT_441989 [Aspergillus brunneoviolaceus CBS 621.78]RAH46779.1 hypothetical protein BO95DRAFT_441989 [Aspergillus brunneoviolaceus CBS 621.78]
MREIGASQGQVTSLPPPSPSPDGRAVGRFWSGCTAWPTRVLSLQEAAMVPCLLCTLSMGWYSVQ